MKSIEDIVLLIATVVISNALADAGTLLEPVAESLHLFAYFYVPTIELISIGENVMNEIASKAAFDITEKLEEMVD